MHLSKRLARQQFVDFNSSKSDHVTKSRKTQQLDFTRNKIGEQQ